MGECSIGVGEWFENEEGVGLWDDSNGGGIGEQGYELVSSRRRSAVSGKVWLGIGWVKGGKMQDEETARQVWRELKNLSTSKMGSLTTVPAVSGGCLLRFAFDVPTLTFCTTINGLLHSAL